MWWINNKKKKNNCKFSIWTSYFLFFFFFGAYSPGISGTRCRTSSMAKLPAAVARAGPTIVSADVWPRIVSVYSGTDIPRDFWFCHCSGRSSFTLPICDCLQHRRSVDKWRLRRYIVRDRRYLTWRSLNGEPLSVCVETKHILIYFVRWYFWI